MASSATSDVLQVRNLKKRFRGGGGVDAVSMTVQSGSVTGFIGVNGAGKSTTLRCILGLLPTDAGEISLFGRAADGASRRRTRIRGRAGDALSQAGRTGR